MFETICYDHWQMDFTRREPSMFNMFYCARNDCDWCRLHQVLFTYKPNKRFIRNVNRHIGNLKLLKLDENLKLELRQRTRVRKLFLITE